MRHFIGVLIVAWLSLIVLASTGAEAAPVAQEHEATQSIGSTVATGVEDAAPTVLRSRIVTREYPNPYPTVQAAVDAALDGDTIVLNADAYGEDVVVVDKSLAIQGNDNTVNSLTWNGGGGRIESLSTTEEFSAIPSDPTGEGLQVDFELQGVSVGTTTTITSSHRVDISLYGCKSEGAAVLSLDDDRGTIAVDGSLFLEGLDAHSLQLTFTRNEIWGEAEFVTFGFETTIERNILHATGVGQTGIRLSGDYVGNIHWVEDNRVSGYERGIYFPLSGPDFGARNNFVADCEIGIEIEGAYVSRNVVRNCDVGVSAFYDGSVLGNTVVGCDVGIELLANGSVSVVNNIVTGADIGLSSAGSPTIRCNDLYDNAINYWGIADPTGISGNFQADPLFCDSDRLDYSIDALSPCAPGNHPDGSACGLIGALGVGCDVTGVDDIEIGDQSPRALVTARPNPSRGSIAFDVPGSQAEISLHIFDPNGRRIFGQAAPASVLGRSIVWDGRTEGDVRVAPGVYYYRITGLGSPIVRPVVIIE